jgi:hypothetical protein
MATKNSFGQKWYQQSASQKEELGTLLTLNDGRVFAYAKAGGTALAASKLMLTAAVSSSANDEVVAATSAIGAKSVSVTFGGAMSASAYKDGFLHVNDDTGEGHVYGIKDHAAGTTAVIVHLKDPVRVAITAGAGTVTLTKHPQDGVVVLPAATAAAVGAPAGIPPIPVTASYYFWNQVKGPCAALVHGTIVLGNVVYGDFTASTAVAGALIPASTLAMQVIGGQIGVVLHVNVDAEYALINLSIPGY